MCVFFSFSVLGVDIGSYSSGFGQLDLFHRHGGGGGGAKGKHVFGVFHGRNSSILGPYLNPLACSAFFEMWEEIKGVFTFHLNP